MLFEPDGAELLLHLLLGQFDGCVLAIQHHCAVEVLLGELKLVTELVAFGAPLQELDLQALRGGEAQVSLRASTVA